MNRNPRSLDEVLVAAQCGDLVYRSDGISIRCVRGVDELSWLLFFNALPEGVVGDRIEEELAQRTIESTAADDRKGFVRKSRGRTIRATPILTSRRLWKVMIV